MAGYERPFRLDGKVAFITAAGGSLGSAISAGLAESGASLTVTDIREEAVRTLAGTALEPVVAIKA